MYYTKSAQAADLPLRNKHAEKNTRLPGMPVIRKAVHL